MIALLLTVDIGYYFFKALKNSGPIFEFVSNRVTSIVMDLRKKKDEDRADVWRTVKKVMGVVVMLVVYLMMYPLLSAISVILPGIAFILILFQMLIYARAYMIAIKMTAPISIFTFLRTRYLYYVFLPLINKDFNDYETYINRTSRDRDNQPF